MVQYIFLALGVVGSLLQIPVIGIMTRGAYRRYPGVFFYLLVLFLTSVADFAAYLNPVGFGGWYGNIYYLNNLLRQFSGLIAVVSLLFLATRSHPRKRATRTRIVLGTLVAVTLALLFSQGNSWSLYIVRVCRILSITNALLNVVLWFELIRTRNRDRCLLLVCGGLGLNMAAEAIAQSLMAVSGAAWLVVFANLTSVISYILCLLIWWFAFRRFYVPANTPPQLASR